MPPPYAIWDELESDFPNSQPYTDSGRGYEAQDGFHVKWHSAPRHPLLVDAFHVTIEATGEHVFYSLERRLRYLTPQLIDSKRSLYEGKPTIHPKDLQTCDELAEDFVRRIRTYNDSRQAEDRASRARAERDAKQLAVTSRFDTTQKVIRLQRNHGEAWAEAMKKMGKQAPKVLGRPRDEIPKLSPEEFRGLEAFVREVEREVATGAPFTATPASPTQAPPPSNKRRNSLDGTFRDIPDSEGGAKLKRADTKEEK